MLYEVITHVDHKGRQVGQPHLRITSYNVCYTKLLRDHEDFQVGTRQSLSFQCINLFHDGIVQREDSPCPFSSDIERRSHWLLQKLIHPLEHWMVGAPAEASVITSYSIHYTKLYEFCAVRSNDSLSWNYSTEPKPIFSQID